MKIGPGRSLRMIGYPTRVADLCGTWFRRFADIPGVAYEGDSIRRSGLRDHDAVPQAVTVGSGEERSVSLFWQTSAGTTSASPVHRLAFADADDESNAEARERVLTALELPGTTLDYHFAIQGVLDLLLKRRPVVAQDLSFAEWLAWLDVQLVEAHSNAFRISGAETEFFRISAFEFLVDLYDREGYLHDALAAAERFARFQRDTDTLTQLRARVEQLREEHA